MRRDEGHQAEFLIEVILQPVVVNDGHSQIFEVDLSVWLPVILEGFDFGSEFLLATY